MVKKMLFLFKIVRSPPSKNAYIWLDNYKKNIKLFAFY
jgi:hypothetical protein